MQDIHIHITWLPIVRVLSGLPIDRRMGPMQVRCPIVSCGFIYICMQIYNIYI